MPNNFMGKFPPTFKIFDQIPIIFFAVEDCPKAGL